MGLLILLYLVPISLTAQAIDGIEKAMRRAYEKGSLLTAISSPSWKAGLALTGTDLPAGQTVDLHIHLKKDTDYVLLGTAETENAVLDLYLFDENGVELAFDTEDDATPYLQYRATVGGTYTLRLHLRASNSARLGVALALLQRRGYTLPRDTHDYIARQFFRSALSLRRLAPDLDPLPFVEGWPVVAFVVEPESAIQLDSIQLHTAPYLFAVAGPPDGPQAKVYLLDSLGSVVAANPESLDYPTLEHDATAGKYSLRIELENNTLPNLVFVGCFKR